METTLRLLSLDDLDTWCALREEAHAAYPASFGPSLTDNKIQRLETYLTWLEKSTIWGIFDPQKKLCGVIGYYPETSHLMRHRGNIFSFYVIETARQRGFGRRLLETALAHAKTQGHTQIHLGVMTTLKPAVALYEKLGFQTIGLIKEAVIVNGKPYDEQLMMRSLP